MSAPENLSIGVYERVQPLGQGGMATVYRAYHPRLNRWVALKMIHSAHTNDRSFIARFEREAQIVAALEHPHIVPIYDFFEHQGKWCMVMKFIDGITMKQALADGALLMTDVLHIMTSVGAALDYAHGEGVLHRDIKPSNILLDAKGTPYLSDFGLAKFAASGEASISQNMLIGTPFYMSPEQGESGKEITTRSDIYALGIVLYEMLLGRVPFNDGTPYAIIHDHIYKPLPMPSDVDPTISPLLEGILLTALAKRPEDRYGSVKEMIDALKFALGEILSQPVNSAAVIQRHAAAESIAQYRSSELTLPPAQTPIMANTAIASTPSGAVTQQQPTSESLRRLQIVALVSFLVIALLIGVIIGTRGNNPAPTGMPVVGQGGAGAALNLNLYPIQNLSIEEAEAFRDREPNNPAVYLTLAGAYLQAGMLTEAESAVRQGATYAADDVSYFMQAGLYAASQNSASAAMLSFAAALRLASGNQELYLVVRGAAGEPLYALMSNPDTFTPLQIRALGALRERQPDYQDILITTMIARALIANRMYVQAQELLDIVFTNDQIFAEAVLVRAELLIAQGDEEAARTDLETLTAGRRAPPWVIQAAQTLLDGLAAD